MGKHFYGTSSEKSDAKILANHRAKHYHRGTCYTPASDSTCNEKDGIWTCMAKAHHHRGSCDSGTFPCVNKSNKINKSFEDNLNDDGYTDATLNDHTLDL